MTPVTLAIDPTLNPARIQPVFRRVKRLHIPGFLTPQSAAWLHRALDRDTPWKRSILLRDRGVAVDAAELEALPADQRQALEREMMERARRGFQYTFDNWAVSDEIEAGRRTGHPAEVFYDFLNSPGFLNWIKVMTGDDRAAYCDAQCTRYAPGDYLNSHTDELEGKHRLFAYVMNLTPVWTADWGGILQFIDQDGHIAEGYTPAFNALNIFEVPQPHSVSMVTPFSGASRLAITGWIRSRPPQ